MRSYIIIALKRILNLIKLSTENVIFTLKDVMFPVRTVRSADTDFTLSPGQRSAGSAVCCNVPLFISVQSCALKQNMTYGDSQQRHAWLQYVFYSVQFPVCVCQCSVKCEV